MEKRTRVPGEALRSYCPGQYSRSKRQETETDSDYGGQGEPASSQTSPAASVPLPDIDYLLRERKHADSFS
jgi:hypothetical protein